ncbi:MAG: hypothetical protein KatS3mg104_1543 [Phycisphaerae bacterium]|jgi:hypothetical protein|nr:MAG: hypothetical protein KatS3mg104_1543 [Phycisphaerae bacterium]
MKRAMSDDKLKISWEDLSSESVEKKLKEQQAVASTQEHYQQTNIAVPQRKRRFDFLLSAVVYLSLFGALGGLIGWGLGEILRYRPDAQKQAIELIAQYEQVVKSLQKVQATPEEIQRDTRAIRRAGESNPYFRIYIDPSLSDEEKEEKTALLYRSDLQRDFIAGLIFFGVCGTAISVMLATADSLIERNFQGAIIHGSIASVIGACGGLVVAWAVHWVQNEFLPSETNLSLLTRLFSNTLSWGLMGLFLAATPGIILRNTKRLFIGMTGGMVGGLIGGLLYAPVQDVIGNEMISRLIAVVLIGLLAGLACGIIENVVKTGWLKVESGLIAGKQFVLYRNPTFIGSHPMSHIYLFNDPSVGRRHACIHIVPGGYELEDLPLGSRTLINGKPATRARLKVGDRIRVGQTEFIFQERKPAH